MVMVIGLDADLMGIVMVIALQDYNFMVMVIDFN
jgi:hypothetical protein